MAVPSYVTVVGNLTRDPELRYTKEGQANALLGVAVNRRWQDKASGRWEESTSFFDVVCWRDLAEHAAMCLERGMRVMVAGRLEQRSWESEAGERRHKIEVVADEIGASLRFTTVDVVRTTRLFESDEEAHASPDARPDNGVAQGVDGHGGGPVPLDATGATPRRRATSKATS